MPNFIALAIITIKISSKNYDNLVFYLLIHDFVGYLYNRAK